MDMAVCVGDIRIGLYVCVHLRILQTYGLIAMTYKVELYREWCLYNQLCRSLPPYLPTLVLFRIFGIHRT